MHLLCASKSIPISMKDEVYVLDLLINHQTAKVERAQCKCIAGYVHNYYYNNSNVPHFLQPFCKLCPCYVSAVLHYLVGLKGHHFMTPSQQETSDSENEDDLQTIHTAS